jgi:GxxExxY protein
MAYLHEALTDRIIGCFFDVYNELGYGFLERVYEQSLMIRLRESGIATVRQAPITVHFHGEVVGNYAADLLVEDKVIVEIKAAKCLALEHEYQLINYLRATDIEIGLLVNFGPRPEVRRKAFSNERKSGVVKKSVIADDAEKRDHR